MLGSTRVPFVLLLSEDVVERFCCEGYTANSKLKRSSLSVPCTIPNFAVYVEKKRKKKKGWRLPFSPKEKPASHTNWSHKSRVG